MGKSIAVVGCGLGGLSAAARLAHGGFDVHVYEQKRSPGGKADTKTIGDYRFDTGPSLMSMPDVFEDIFKECNEKIDEYLQYTPLKTHCRYFFEDSTIIDIGDSVEAFAREIAQKTDDSYQSVMHYFKHIKSIYDYAADAFLYSSPFETFYMKEYMSANKLFNMHKIDAMRTLHQSATSFFKDRRTLQIIDRYATYNGSSPYRCPATFNIIPFVEMHGGAYNVKGGIYKITQALYKLAVKKGVRFFFNERVKRIVSDNGHVSGLITDKRKKRYDYIVCNSDVKYAYNELLGQNSVNARRQKNQEPSSSAHVFYWGIKGNYPSLDVHNILFSSNYREEFRHLFGSSHIYNDPTVYINITSKYNSSDAPRDGENWFVMVNAPRHQGQNWDRERARIKPVIIHKIKRLAGIDITNRIEAEGHWDPMAIERDTMSTNGSLYGNSSNGLFSAFLRQANRSRDIGGLYFCGGSAHPGGGMPLVILSGKFVSQIIQRENNE